MSVPAAIIAASLAAASPATTPPAVSNPLAAPAHCDSKYGLHRADSAGEARFKRLDELPPANLILTVYREIDRCPAPIVVRANIGVSRPARRVSDDAFEDVRAASRREHSPGR